MGRLFADGYGFSILAGDSRTIRDYVSENFRNFFFEPKATVHYLGATCFSVNVFWGR